MPRQQGYSGQAGYGRQRQQHATVTGQYESAFNPIPIEFLQEQLRGRQQDYDVAFAGAIQAKEQMAAQQAALQDLGSKNQIIGDTMGNIDKVVEEKYGGDWSRASKEIATMVSSARQNPFWETTKHLKEQQKIQQDFKLKNPNAWIYNDVNQLSSIDPETGQVRSAEDLTFRGGQRSDFAGSIEQQFADVQANVQDFALQQVKTEGVQGMLQKTRIEEIKDTELRKMADQGVDTFLTNNQDYLEGYMSQGMTEEEVRKQAGDDIYGQIRDKAYREATSQVTQAPKATTTGAGAGSQGIVRSQAAQYINMLGTDLKSGQVQRKSVNDELSALEGREDPDSIARVAELEAQRYEMDNNFDFVFDSMQSGVNSVDIGSYFTSYGTDIEKLQEKDPSYKAMSKDEFDTRVMEHLRNGTRETSPGASAMNISSFSAESVRINQAVTKLKKGFKEHAKKGQAVINANVITGTEGAAAEDTFAGQYNQLLSEDWRSTTAGYTVPYSDRQIGDIYENEKKYDKRDPNKDTMVMTDGTINGEFVYQLNAFDKNGKPLGSEYVVPDNQTDAYAHIMKSGQELIQQGINQNDPYYVQLGQSIVRNANYGPAVQKAKLHDNTKGTFKGVNYGNREIKYENVGTFENPMYNYYTEDSKGNKDWFDYEDENGKTLRYNAVDEDGVKRHLEAFVNFAQQQNQ